MRHLKISSTLRQHGVTEIDTQDLVCSMSNLEHSLNPNHTLKRYQAFGMSLKWPPSGISRQYTEYNKHKRNDR